MPEIKSYPINEDKATDSYVYVNPLTFKEADLPLVLCVDDRNSLFGWAIKWHEKGEYNHICVINRPGFVVSQDPGGFREKPLDVYLKPNLFLKFWQYDGLSPLMRARWLALIQKKIDHKEGYDWLGIVGQAIGLPWVHNPWRQFCAEDVAEQCHEAFNFNIPGHLDPQGINDYFNKNMKPPMRVAGYFWKE